MKSLSNIPKVDKSSDRNVVLQWLLTEMCRSHKNQLEKLLFFSTILRKWKCYRNQKWIHSLNTFNINLFNRNIQTKILTIAFHKLSAQPIINNLNHLKSFIFSWKLYSLMRNSYTPNSMHDGVLSNVFLLDLHVNDDF